MYAGFVYIETGRYGWKNPSTFYRACHFCCTSDRITLNLLNEFPIPLSDIIIKKTKSICLKNVRSTRRSDKETAQNFTTCLQLIVNSLNYLRRITYLRLEILFIIYFVNDFLKVSCDLVSIICAHFDTISLSVIFFFFCLVE